MQCSIKHIKQLQKQKFRNSYNQFVAEGIKTISDIVSFGYKPVDLLYFDEGDNNIPKNLKKLGRNVPFSTLQKVSSLKTPPPILAVFEKFYNENEAINNTIFKKITNDYVLFLDDISDPGNFGTIIRTTDWMGFRNIVCTKNTVELYNSKVVQATMGAITNVRVYYLQDDTFFKLCKQDNIPIYGLDMNGEDINSIKFGTKGIFVIGSESNGLSTEIQSIITNKISIKPYKNDRITPNVSESLNAAIACAILCFKLRS
ncbi:MAG: RNA methyltransferase [Bacteroidales bacterium]|jgi:TrmH family RNA methyltransferase